MAKNKAILERIHSVHLTQQITRTMKMVAASSLERKKKQAAHIATHAEELEKLLADVLPCPQAGAFPLLAKKNLKKSLLIAVGTHKGLCGSFLQTVLGKTFQYYTKCQEEHNHALEILPSGKKTVLFCQKKNLPHVTHRADFHADLKEMQDMGAFVLELFRDRYQCVHIVYQPQGLNPDKGSVVLEQLLPILLPAAPPRAENPFLWEPSQPEVLEALLPQVFALRLYRALTTSYIAEQKARMMTMHHATENADALLKELKVAYNRNRQNRITTEIAEINAGAKFLNH